jgi:hypothetical protein
VRPGGIQTKMNKILVFGPLLLGAVSLLPAFGDTTVVGNFASWNGSTTAFSFGVPYSIAFDTYGQTFTVPAGQPVISDMSFWVGWNFGGGVTFSGYLMAWDGMEATGPVLFQSTPASVDSSTPGIAKMDFPMPNITLVPGNRYVFFLLASVGSGGAATARLAVTADSSSYAGGNFVFTGSGGAFSNLSSPWLQTDTASAFGDAVFEASFNSPQATNVTNSVSVTSAGLIYNRVLKQGTETVTIRNTSAQTISGPIQLVLSLSAGATPANNTGTFSGNPYWTVSTGSLAPGASATVTVTLKYNAGTNVTTTASVYSGSLQ